MLKCFYLKPKPYVNFENIYAISKLHKILYFSEQFVDILEYK